MKLDFTESEATFVSTLLESTHRERLHELHHTSTRAYATMLREEIDLIESLRAKLEAVVLVEAH